jgi:hypothetical protein
MSKPIELQRATLTVLDRMSVSIEDTRVNLGSTIARLIDCHVALSDQVSLLCSRIESLEQLNRQLIDVTLGQTETIRLLIEAEEKRASKNEC